MDKLGKAVEELTGTFRCLEQRQNQWGTENKQKWMSHNEEEADPMGESEHKIRREMMGLTLGTSERNSHGKSGVTVLQYTVDLSIESKNLLKN